MVGYSQAMAQDQNTNICHLGKIPLFIIQSKMEYESKDNFALIASSF